MNFFIAFLGHNYPRNNFSGSISITADQRNVHNSAMPSGSQNLAEEKDDRATAMVSLVLILDLMFILNQISYCVMAGCTINKTLKDSTEAEEIFFTACFVNDTIECLSHSLNFYLYLKFSSLFRRKFFDFLYRLRNKCL